MNRWYSSMLLFENWLALFIEADAEAVDTLLEDFRSWVLYRSTVTYFLFENREEAQNNRTLYKKKTQGETSLSKTSKSFLRNVTSS